MSQLYTTDIPAKLLRVVPSAAYTSQALAFSTARQPNTIRPTFVIPTIRIDTGQGEEGTVDFQISPDNTTYTTIATWRSYASTSGLLSGGTTMHKADPATIIVPKGNYYKMITTNVSGTPTFSLVRMYELAL